MKRSEVNACIREFEAALREHCFPLPPFLSFTPEEWAEKGSDYDEIRDNARETLERSGAWRVIPDLTSFVPLLREEKLL